jgi:hypothetical protein
MNTGIGRDPIPGITRLFPHNTYLRVCNGPGANRKFDLKKPRLLLGRNDPNMTVDIDLSSCELSNPPQVSRRHAELRWVNGELELIDLGSTNGTFVDGQKLKTLGSHQHSDPVKLKIGSKIHIGNLELEVIRHE